MQKKFCLMEGKCFSSCEKVSFANSSQYYRFKGVSSLRSPSEPIEMGPSISELNDIFDMC